MNPYFVAYIIGSVIAYVLIWIFGSVVGEDRASANFREREKEMQRRWREAEERSAMWSREYHKLKREYHETQNKTVQK